MRSDFDLITKKIDNQDIIIYPISDLHVGALEFLEKEWHDFVRLILSQPNAYITIGGDMMNNSTRSSVANVFEETMRPSDQKKWLANELAPIRDRILCATPGNHENRSEKDADDNPMYDVMAKLDLEDLYRQNMAFVKIQMGDNRKDGKTNPTYVIGVIHGAGGGIYTGATVNRNERFAYIFDGMDILIVGHSHKGAITKPQRMIVNPRQNRIYPSEITVISSTSWMQYGGYALRKMLLPSSQAMQRLELAGNKKQIQTVW